MFAQGKDEVYAKTYATAYLEKRDEGKPKNGDIPMPIRSPGVNLPKKPRRMPMVGLQGVGGIS